MTRRRCGVAFLCVLFLLGFTAQSFSQSITASIQSAPERVPAARDGQAQNGILTGECRIHQCGIEWPASPSEIEGLECAAMWEPHHVEERLRDHFAGVPNATCLALKPARSLA